MCGMQVLNLCSDMRIEVRRSEIGVRVSGILGSRARARAVTTGWQNLDSVPSIFYSISTHRRQMRRLEAHSLAGYATDPVERDKQRQQLRP